MAAGVGAVVGRAEVGGAVAGDDLMNNKLVYRTHAHLLLVE